MTKPSPIKLEFIKGGFVIGAAFIAAVGGWLVHSTQAKSSHLKERFTMTYFIPPKDLDKNICVDKIAARLSKMDFIYDAKGGVQGRTISLHWDGTSAFVYCIAKNPKTDLTDIVVAGQTFTPESESEPGVPPRWIEFIHVIEGALVQS